MPATDMGEKLRRPAITPFACGPPAFAEPWQAEAVAMKALLQERGLFDAAEWSQALGAQLREAERAGDAHAERYYDCWLAALEHLIAAKGLADAAHLQSPAAAWSRAAEATPHGRPIELANDPLGGAEGTPLAVRVTEGRAPTVRR